MRLSRRDAVAALAAAGIGVGGAAVYGSESLPGQGADDGGPSDGSPSDGSSEVNGVDVETLVSLAEVLYPSAVDGIEEFVGTYARGRFGDDPERARRVSEAIDVLDARASDQFDAAFRRLSAEERDGVLRELGQRYAPPDPEGDERGRVRYYLVNELLYALFSSPEGGRLAGTENPAGHPGGLEAYQQGPQT